MTSLSFTVLGRAQPAGSKRAYINQHTGRATVVDAAKGSRPWKQQIAGEALTHRDGSDLLTGALAMQLEFYVARPAGHFGTGRNAAQVRPGAPGWPAVRPDATKLTRAVEDALTGVLWRDDAQIVHQIVTKLYGDPERVEIRVWEMPA